LFEEDNLVSDETKADPAAWADVIGGDADFEEEFSKVVSDKKITEADDEFAPDSYDSYLNMELWSWRWPIYAKVTERLKDKWFSYWYSEAEHRKKTLHRVQY